MPTYRYRCNNCNYEFEKLQSIISDPLKTCPECSGEVKRLIGSGTGIIFKGSGFYVNDYKKKEGEKGSSLPQKKHTHNGHTEKRELKNRML